MGPAHTFTHPPSPWILPRALPSERRPRDNQSGMIPVSLTGVASKLHGNDLFPPHLLRAARRLACVPSAFAPSGRLQKMATTLPLPASMSLGCDFEAASIKR